MRVLVPLALLLAATATVAVPPAAACHMTERPPEVITGGYYVITDVDYGGCPHKLTFCVQVWRETNGQPGLQRTGPNPDHAVVVVCPYP